MTALQRLAGPRQLATLLAFLHTLEATAQDDVLDLVDNLLTDLFAEAVNTGQGPAPDAQRFGCRCRPVAACLCRLVRRYAAGGTGPHGRLCRSAARDAGDAMHQVDRLVRPPDEVYYPELQASYRRVGVSSHLSCVR